MEGGRAVVEGFESHMILCAAEVVEMNDHVGKVTPYTVAAFRRDFRQYHEFVVDL